jgi:tetraacyldisaccharide 4'-kinase
LRLAETPYSLAVTWRNRRFDRLAACAFRASVPVISVGNVTLGGTGKTPMVEWLARWFGQRGVRVALVSRGYGTAKGLPNDEAIELAERLPDVPHVQNPHRVEAVWVAIHQLACQLIILDDAFQHRRIARDLDVVMLDALEPFGYGHVFPRGMLREPLRGLCRADVIALSRANLVSDTRRMAIWEHVSGCAPSAIRVELDHRPVHLRSATGGTATVSTLAGRPVAAFCGIGNPAGFEQTLAACQFCVVGFREFPDHHAYGQADVDGLASWVRSLPPTDAVLCTHKDLVKIRLETLADRPLWSVSIGVEIRSGQAELEESLGGLLGQIK